MNRLKNLCLVYCLITALNLISAPLEIKRLTGNFYIYTTYKNFDGKLFPSNSMYLVTDSGAVMFDTPWDSTQFQPLLDSIWKRHGKKVVMSFSTHFHDDRTAGISFLRNQGVRTYTSYQTWQLCASNNIPQSTFVFMKDTTFSVGGYTFSTLYPGPGHAPDNIVVWFPSEHIVYGGCLVKSTENHDLGYIGDADLKAWPESIKKVIKQCPHPAYVIPGHFSWTNKNSLQHTLKLLKKKR